MSKNSETVNAAINETLAFLDTEYDVDKTLHKDIVLFVGITGTGKSTLSQFLAGNPNLIAVRHGIAGDFYITDGNEKVSESTTESKTLIPELVAVPNTDTVLADCPGFGDTRSAKHDIAAAIFTKKLLDKAEQVKIIITTAHHSVRKSVDRSGFTDLLAHVAYFLKDIDKYKDSIGLVATKVENQSILDEEENLIFVPDADIISEIGSFLSDVKSELLEKQQDSLTSKQIKLIDILIAKNGKEEYSKIAIFRRPTKIGDLTKIPRLMKNRDTINDTMNNALQSTVVTSNDFGLSLSSDSKYIVSGMRETLNEKLSNILDDYINAFSQPPVANSVEMLVNAVTRSIAVVDLLKSADNANMVVSDLMQSIETLDPGRATQQYADWKKQQEYLKFLESLAPTTDDTNDSIKYRTRIIVFKDRIYDNAKKMGHDAEKAIDQAISDVVAEIVERVRIETVNLEISSVVSYSMLSEKISQTFRLYDDFKTASQSKPKLTFVEFLNNLKVSINISGRYAQKLESLRTAIEIFKRKIDPVFTDGHQNKWLQGFTVPLNAIVKKANWYYFIADSYTKLTDNDGQYVIANNRRNLKDWTHFKQVRKTLGTNRAIGIYLESRLTLSQKEQTDLNNLIDEVQPSIDHICQSSQLIVQGNIVKLSTVMATIIQQCASFTELFIFATQQVIIDESLLWSSRNVYIVAPTWRVRGPQLINLRGADAVEKNFVRIPLLPFFSPITNAGNPGQPGGNFIGIGDKFINGNDLTIDVSGGNGSNGQDGDNGRDGDDGRTPPVPETTNWHAWASKDECTTRIEKDAVAGFELQGDRIFKMFGTNGTPGSRGGNGGMAGYGAKPGYVFVDANSNIVKKADYGQNGAMGRGGIGGIGGTHGSTRVIKCHLTISAFVKQFSYTHYSFDDWPDRAADGDNGIPGIEGSPEHAEEPQPFVSLSIVAWSYKHYSQQSISYFTDSGDFINRFISNNRKRSVPSLHTASPVVGNINWTQNPLTIGHKSGSLITESWTSEFSVSSFVALADVLLRKVMKTKSKDFTSPVDSNWENLLVQAEVLKIIEKCEKKWAALNQTNPQHFPFDALCLQKELNSRLKQLVDKSQVQLI